MKNGQEVLRMSLEDIYRNYAENHPDLRYKEKPENLDAIFKLHRLIQEKDRNEDPEKRIIFNKVLKLLCHGTIRSEI